MKKNFKLTDNERERFWYMAIDFFHDVAGERNVDMEYQDLPLAAGELDQAGAFMIKAYENVLNALMNGANEND